MTRLSLSKKKVKRVKFAMAMQWWLYILHLLGLFMELAYRMVERQCMQRVRSRYRLDFYDNRDVIEKWVYESDSKCMNDFRMPRRPFVKLCHLLSTIGKLEPTRHMLVDEQVAIFLHTLAHHIKNRTLQNDFHRSAEAISRSFRKVLIAVIRLQGHLYKKPEPIPENSTDETWKWFKGCLGALDGTHIPVQVPAVDRPRYRNRKGMSMEKKVHRKWNDEEDRELIYALHDLVSKGDKRDNGFKAGSLTVIEGVLREKLPGHGIRAKPHIESRIKTLKKDVTTVYDMIFGGSTSGFGWDPNTNMVVAENDIWDGYVKSHKDAATWRNRSFPHFEMLLTVFGKDRATGKNAVTAEDVLEEESRNEGSCDTENLGIGIEEMEHFLLNKEESTSQGKKRKRVDDSLDAFREAAMIIGSKIEKATEKFSEALGVDLATSKKRDKINEELLKLSNLSMIQRHRALLAIARDHEMTGCFFTLKDEEKEPFVKSLLKGDFNL